MNGESDLLRRAESMSAVCRRMLRAAKDTEELVEQMAGQWGGEAGASAVRDGRLIVSGLIRRSEALAGSAGELSEIVRKTVLNGGE